MESIECFISSNQVLSITVACLVGFVGFVSAIKWINEEVSIGSILLGLLLSPIWFFVVCFGLLFLAFFLPLFWYEESELRKKVSKSLKKKVF